MEKLKVLVVDNAAFVRELVKNNLRSQFFGLSIHDVDSARKAQSLLRLHTIDLLLCDWEMSEMSGQELLLWLRGLEGSPNQQTPVVMLSSSIDKEHLLRAVEAGVSEYLTKPFNPEQLLTKLTKVFARLGKLEQARGLPSRLSVQGSATESLSVLTGSKTRSAPKPAASVAEVAVVPSAPVRAGRIQAQLSWAESQYECDVKALNLNELKAQIERRPVLPQLFEAVQVRIQSKKVSLEVEVQAYIHALQAADLLPNSAQLLLTLRFSDPDPDNMELLSKFISSL